MTVEKRKFYRIFTTTYFKFGPERKMLFRQINISAGGAAFQVTNMYYKALSIGDRISFEIEIMNEHHKLDGEVVRMVKIDHKNLIAIRYVELPSDIQEALNDQIHSMGGYYRDDVVAKQEYLKRNYPDMIE